MKSLHISPIAPNSRLSLPIRRGAARRWIEKAERKLAQPYDVQIAALKDPRQTTHESNTHLIYDRIRPGRTDIRLFHKIPDSDPCKHPRRISRTARPFQPERIHIHGGVLQRPPARRKAPLRTPATVYRHNDPALKLHQWRYRSNYGSVFIRAAFVDLPDIPVEHYAMIHRSLNIADYTSSRSIATRRCEIRAHLGIPADPRVLRFCERVAPEKERHRLTTAAATLIASRPGLRLAHGQTARQAAKQRCGWAITANRAVSLYRTRRPI
ncbi:MAG TPA: hypothetical protein DEP05_02430 [Betaproteobacteria bacterium]|nr:hypothetical protein [Betaproteobacteria bacterium]